MKLWNILQEFFSQRKRDDKGAGSISLMVVSLAVTMMAGMALTSATVTLSSTYDQLSKKEADASAEFALNDAVSRFSQGNCLSAMYNSPSGWRWQIFKSAQEDMPMSNRESQVFSGCPTPDDKWVVIVATGKGRENTFTTKTAVYRTYGDGSSVIPQAITGKRIVLNNNEPIKKAPGLSDSNGIMYAGTGGYNCVDTETEINIVSLNGPADQMTRCPMNGDFNTNGTSYFGTGSYLNGDLCSTVSVTDASSKMIRGINKKSDSSCASKVKGTFYGYLPDPRDAVKFNSTQCNDWNTFRARIMAMKGDRNVADLTDCTISNIGRTINGTGNKTIPLSGNVTIVMNEGMDAQKITVSSTDGKPYTLSFTTPSAIANSTESTCSNTSETSVFSQITYQPGTSGVLYTPCNMTIQNSTIRGQVYAGETLNISQSKLEYSLVELPYAFRPVADIGRAQQLTRVY